MKAARKKKWSKPECTRIRLVPAEAVLVACKNDHGHDKCKSHGTPTVTYGS